MACPAAAPPALARGRAAGYPAAGAGSEHFTGWAFVTPGVVIILLFGAVPIVWSAVMSFQQNNLLSPEHAVRRAPPTTGRWSTTRWWRRRSGTR